MATTFEGHGEEKKFENHPEGTFTARVADVWTEEKPNPYKGKIGKNPKTGANEVDLRDNITKVRIKFLTEEVIELDGKEYPKVVMYFGNFTWGDTSRLRNLIRGFAPDIAALPKWEVDLDRIIGLPVTVTVTKWEDSDNTSVSAASGVHKSLLHLVPEIPEGFKRKQDKVENAATPEVSDVNSEEDPF